MNRNKQVSKVEEIEHHRNGVAGTGFYIVKFVSTDGDNMLAVVFPDQGSVAVFDRDLLKKDVINFGVNSWRGDYYEPELRDAIKKHYDDKEADAD